MFNFDCNTKQYVVYSVKDPSVNLELSNISEYQSSLDKKHLVFHDWQKDPPTVFTMKPLTVADKIELTAMSLNFPETENRGDQYRNHMQIGIKTLEISLIKIDDNEVKTKEDVLKLGSELIIELVGYAKEVSQLPLAARQGSES